MRPRPDVPVVGPPSRVFLPGPTTEVADGSGDLDIRAVARVQLILLPVVVNPTQAEHWSAS